MMYLPELMRAVEGDGLFVFFAYKRGDGIFQTEAVEERFVGIDVQLLLLLALDVGLADGPVDVVERGQADLGLDHLGGESDAGEEIAEGAAGLADSLLLLLNVLLEGGDHGDAVSSLNVTMIAAWVR